MRPWSAAGIFLLNLFVSTAALAASGATLSYVPADPPPVRPLLTAEEAKKVLDERDTIALAALKDEKLYSFHVSLLLRGSIHEARTPFFNQKFYDGLPLVTRAVYSPAARTIEISGGIWQFKLTSVIQLEERGERWFRFKIVSGSFVGLAGDFYFERSGEKDTLIYVRGEKTGTQWPPRVVLERGAEIAFTYTALQLRKFVEAERSVALTPVKGEENNGQQVPQPRRR